MSTRSAKRSASDSPALSNLESLILAQAVYEVGASAATWPSIAKLLSKHPLLSRPKSFFTPQSCHAMYDDLLKNAGLQFTDKNASPHAPVNTQLAQKYYTLRFNELRDLIAGEEAKFKSIISEIQDIRSGAWDEKLKAKITGKSDAEKTAEINKDDEKPQANEEVETQTTEMQEKRPRIEEEVFDGSDLSGVTDSTSSPSQTDEIEKKSAELSSPNVSKNDGILSSESITEKSGGAEQTVEPSKESNDADMDTAEDERAEENELADQLVPGQISPIVSSPNGDEIIDAEPAVQSQDTDTMCVSESHPAFEGHHDSPALESDTHIPENTSSATEQHVPINETDNTDQPQESQDQEAFEKEDPQHIQPTESIQPEGEDQHSSTEYINVQETEVEKVMEEDKASEVNRDGQESANNKEGQNELQEESVDTEINSKEQAEGLQDASEDDVPAVESVFEVGEPAQNQKEQIELRAPSEDGMSVDDERVEKQQVGDSEANPEHEEDAISVRGDAEDTEVDLSVEKTPESVDDRNSIQEQETPHSEQQSEEATSRHEQELKVSAPDEDAVSEDDKEDELEVANTPLDAGLAADEPQSKEKATIKEEDSSDEGPSPPPRRSTRRRKSSVTSTNALVPARGRPRRQSHLAAEQESPSPMEVDPEPDSGLDDDKPLTEDALPSPALVGVTVSRRRDGKRKAAFDGADTPRKRARDESEPVEEEEIGPSVHNTRGRPPRQIARTEEQKRFQNVIGMLHSQISQHRNGNIFHNPIKNTEAPDYHDIVKRPMDLKTIKAKVKDGLIANSLEYQRDIYLMFANAMMYNRPESDVHSMAEDMMLESEGYIRTFRQTEGLVRGNRG